MVGGGAGDKFICSKVGIIPGNAWFWSPEAKTIGLISCGCSVAAEMINRNNANVYPKKKFVKLVKIKGLFINQYIPATAA